MPRYRIGIDVGGTFTHAVALDARGSDLVAQAQVPTTHRAARGVAEGVIQALRSLIDTSGMRPEDIAFLAYSTTQVTNALLEGDVAPVGILALGSGLEGRRAARETRIGNISLAPGRELRTIHAYLDVARTEDGAIRRAVTDLREAGAAAIVAAQAFSVDDPRMELEIMARAEAVGLPATGTHEIAGRYGLRVRTRTAAINAGLLPKAIATADLTEGAAREIGITAPLMVVRSDGGVMSVEDMRRRPLLTLLSGPAAGVAAALMYARVSEGVFLEVGGTSTDISAIRHGRALLRTAEVGGHRLYLRTVDVRTIGVAGGSMARIAGAEVRAVGPRSAHMAGLPYACFTDRIKPDGSDSTLQTALISPIAGDPEDYVVVVTPRGERIAVTLTCAANVADLVPEGDFARGNLGSARAAFAALGGRLETSPEEAARAMIDAAIVVPTAVVGELLEQRGMARAGTELIAGGGGASVLVPAVGRELGLPARAAPNAPVISAIGTALALVREVIERTVPDASEEDVLRVRREAVEAVVRQGADPASVSVDIEYDARTAVLRASASGHTELRERDLEADQAGDEERRRAAAKSLGAAPDDVTLVADAGLLRGYRGASERRRLFGLLKERGHGIALVDQQAVVRLVLPGGSVRGLSAGAVREGLSDLLEEETRYGDAGAELPQLFLGVRGRIVNLSGLVSKAQVLSLAEAELAGMETHEPILAATARRGV